MPGPEKITNSYNLHGIVDSTISDLNNEIRKFPQIFTETPQIVSIGPTDNSEDWKIQRVKGEIIVSRKDNNSDYKETKRFISEKNAQNYLQSIYKKSEVVRDTVLRRGVFEDVDGNRWKYNFNGNDDSYHKVKVDKNNQPISSTDEIVKDKNGNSNINAVINEIEQFFGSQQLTDYFFTHGFQNFPSLVKNAFSNEMNINAYGKSSTVFKQNKGDNITITETANITGIEGAGISEIDKTYEDGTPRNTTALGEMSRVIQLSENEGKAVATIQSEEIKFFDSAAEQAFLSQLDPVNIDKIINLAGSRPQVLANIQSRTADAFSRYQQTQLNAIDKFFNRFSPDSLVVALGRTLGLYNPAKIEEHQKARQDYRRLAQVRAQIQKNKDFNDTISHIEQVVDRVKKLPINDGSQKMMELLETLGMPDKNTANMLMANDPKQGIHVLRDFIFGHQDDYATYISNLWVDLKGFEDNLPKAMSFLPHQNSSFAAMLNSNVLENSTSPKGEVDSSDDEVVEVIKTSEAAKEKENVIEPEQVLANLEELINTIADNFYGSVQNEKIQQVIDTIFPDNSKNGVNETIVRGLMHTIDNQHSWRMINNEMMQALHKDQEGFDVAIKKFNQNVEAIQAEIQQVSTNIPSPRP